MGDNGGFRVREFSPLPKFRPNLIFRRSERASGLQYPRHPSRGPVMPPPPLVRRCFLTVGVGLLLALGVQSQPAATPEQRAEVAWLEERSMLRQAGDAAR